MTARASSEQAAREFLDESHGHYVLKQEQIDALAPDLAALLDARERPLLEQVAILQAALVEIQANGWCPCVTIAGRALAIARARSQTEGA